MSFIEKELMNIINADSFIERDDLVVINVKFYDEHNGELWDEEKYLLLRKTAENLNLQYEYKIFNESEELSIVEDVFGYFCGGAICSMCYYEYIDKHKLILPFPTKRKRN